MKADVWVKTITVPICPPQTPRGLTLPWIKPRPLLVTNHLNHDTAKGEIHNLPWKAIYWEAWPKDGRTLLKLMLGDQLAL